MQTHWSVSALACLSLLVCCASRVQVDELPASDEVAAEETAASEAAELDTIALDELMAREDERRIYFCVAAISVAAGSAAIPFTKIVALRRFLRAAGSARAAAKIMLKAGTLSQKIEAVSKVVVGAGSEVLGIQAIRDNC
jgi:hypothetical protein